MPIRGAHVSDEIFFGHVRGRMPRACVRMVGKGRFEGGESSSCHVWPQFVSDLLRYSTMSFDFQKCLCMVSRVVAVIYYIVRILFIL